MSFIDDFLEGQLDCCKGIPHKEGMSDDYTRGYSSEYEMAAIQDEITRDKDEVIRKH